MLIEQPPLFYRLFFPEALWRLKLGDEPPTAFVTFDDGPVPEVTPWVLDQLDAFDIKATFFMVGDNVRRNPELLQEVKDRGHAVGNHTMHHLQGIRTLSRRYLRDISEANALIGSNMFRPPHGIMRPGQAKVIKDHYNIVMYDVVSRDYSSKLTPGRVVDNVKRYTRPGSIVVFHDSLKAWPNLREALPDCLAWLKANFTLRRITTSAPPPERRPTQ